MSAPVVVLVTFPSKEVARNVSSALVGEKLAACVNLLPGAESLYWWKDRVEVAPEVVGLIKTTRSMLEELKRKYLSLHPYAVAEFIVVDLAGGSAPYLDWLRASVRGAGS